MSGDPFETKFTDTRRFDLLMIAVGVLVAVLFIGGVVWALQSTNDPAYEPPHRVSYRIGALS